MVNVVSFKYTEMYLVKIMGFFVDSSLAMYVYIPYIECKNEARSYKLFVYWIDF